MIRIGAIVDGKYQVTGILGRGGMGIVVEARHLALDTLVAIKFMRSDMVLLSGGSERFLREARALVKLKSQHAVKVHDMGIHQRLWYIVMEHLDGADLQTILKRQGGFDAATAAKHVLQACEAIAEAHSLGICHRDLKPANIFLTRGASGRNVVKVLDFGIAKLLRTTSAERYRSLTETRTMMGTLHYMSPEQVASSKNIDSRSDIWSLGVVLYQLVTNALPFDNQNSLELQHCICSDAPRAIDLPPALARIVYRCLEKNREDRYQTAVDLALALRPLIHESLSPFGAISSPYEAKVPAARERPVVPPDSGEPPSTDKDPRWRGFNDDQTMKVEPRTMRGEEYALALAEGIVSRHILEQADATTVLQLPKQVGMGGTLIMDAEGGPTVRERLPEPPNTNFADTLHSADIENAPSAPIVPDTPRQSSAVAAYQRAIVLGIVLAAVVFLWVEVMYF